MNGIFARPPPRAPSPRGVAGAPASAAAPDGAHSGTSEYSVHFR